MEQIVNMVGTAILANFITFWFEPIQPIKNKLLNVIVSSRLAGIRVFGSLLDCGRCLAFWVYLIIDQNIFTAAITSVLAFLFTFMIDKIQDWYE